MNAVKKEIIVTWLKRIQSSELSVSQFFSQYSVPFSRSQYFVYKKKFAESGIDGFVDQRKEGGNRKIGHREEAFLQGYVAGGGSLSLSELQQILRSEFLCEVSLTTLKRKLNEVAPNRPRAKIGRPRSQPSITYNPLGGFELLVAVAYYLEWPKRTTDAIICALNELKIEDINQNHDQFDLQGRNRQGQFTSGYNQREDVRQNRFASVSEKYKHKNWSSLELMKVKASTISKKNLAVLSLPIVTGNGRVRTVNLALGQTLKHFCGFNYTQGTLSRFLSELKSVGVSSFLLSDLPEFWCKCWGSEFSKNEEPLLCYYIDGNTKALWSSERVKQNKVTMLGRVMGCLEQVFVYDGLGHPIYFETYSGHAPFGEYVLSLFEKIEVTISSVPGSNTHVLRALIMDSANNSVKTIRAFAAQDKYHFITPLDNNQYNEQRDRSRRSYPVRYKYGDALLRDIEIELTDSTEKGYLISVRAVRIEWDNGKRTVLVTSIPKNQVDAHEIVSSYFKRWPAEELRFREQKATVSLNRVAGYGKKEVENPRVKEALSKLDIKKNKLENKLAEPLEKINLLQEQIAKLIPKERRLRAKSLIKDGKRIVPSEIRVEFEKCSQKIQELELAIKAIEKIHAKELSQYRKTFQEWLRLQGKETVFEADVELDQILTYYRASLVHICAYFIKHFLGGKSISLVMLFHRVVQLEAHIEETRHERKVTLQNNKQDPVMMASLASAIEKLNLLSIRGNNKKIYRFQLEQS